MNTRLAHWVILVVVALVVTGARVASAGGPNATANKDKKTAAKAPAPKAAPAAKKAAAKKAFRRLPTTVARPRATMIRRVSQGNRRYTVRIRTRDVYYGNYRNFRTAGEIDTQKVFEAISHYRTIKREGLTKKSGRYWILMQKANRVFHQSLRRVSRETHVDIIAGRNAIDAPESPPADVTPHMIATIRSIESRA